MCFLPSPSHRTNHSGLRDSDNYSLIKKITLWGSFSNGSLSIQRRREVECLHISCVEVFGDWKSSLLDFFWFLLKKKQQRKSYHQTSTAGMETDWMSSRTRCGNPKPNGPRTQSTALRAPGTPSLPPLATQASSGVCRQLRNSTFEGCTDRNQLHLGIRFRPCENRTCL